MHRPPTTTSTKHQPDQGEWLHWRVAEAKWSSVVWNSLQSGFARRSVSAALWNAKPEIPPSFAHLVKRGWGGVLAQDSGEKDSWPPSCVHPMLGSWWIRSSSGSHIFWISFRVLSLWQMLIWALFGPKPDFYFSVNFKLLLTTEKKHFGTAFVKV